MSNVAPEHGPTPFGAVGTGGHIPIGKGVRPAMPADQIGTVSPNGPNNEQQFADPNDPDNDMDTETAGDY